MAFFAVILFWLPALMGLPSMEGQTDNRAGATLPLWEVNDAWSYHTDDKHLDSYPIVLVSVPDPNTGLPVDTVLCNYPTGRDIVDEYLLAEKGALDYNMSVWQNVTETGTWMMRQLVTGKARCDAGDIAASGTYNKTENNTGSELMRVSNINPDGDILFSVSESEYIGTYYFIITITSTYITTVDKPCQEWKPDWDSGPMDTTSQWTMDCTQTQTYVEHWQSKGNLDGEFTEDGTYHFTYDMNWTVPQKAPQTVMENTYADSYEVQGTGTMVWDWEDGSGNKQNGQGNVQGRKWYADQGQYWDAAWGIIYEGEKYLVWSTTGPPIDWNNPPQVMKAPPSKININEEEDWTFLDYQVKDTDPGACGSAGFVYSTTATYEGGPVLPGLEIDQSGMLSLRPAQEDVADGYEVTISVRDSCPGSAQTTDMKLLLNIKNVNDPPTANTSIMQDVWLYENNNTVTDWSIYDVFHDIDMDKSTLTGQPYDPLETLSYSVRNNGSLLVDIDSVLGNVTFTALDKQFPVSQNFSLIFTATDKAGLQSSDGMTAHVLHKNHNPYSIPGKETIETDEDTNTSVKFTDYFKDFDVANPSYLTTDTLYYYAWARGNVSVENKNDIFKLIPWPNWSGEETIYLRASDMWGGRVETEISILVRPVNDQPKVFFLTPDTTEVLELDEPMDPWSAGGHDLSRTLVLSVTAQDVETDNLDYNWTVEDMESGDVLKWATMAKESMMTFRTAFIGDFMDGNFTGGQDTKEYSVEVTVSDGRFTIIGGKWTIRVYNVNRVPRLQGISVDETKNGLKTPVLEDDFRNYTFGYGKRFEISLGGSIIDGDNALKTLDCRWTIDQGLVILSDKCNERSAINITTGTKLGIAQVKLKPGLHNISFSVTDDQGATANLQIWVRVNGPPPTMWDDMQTNGLLIAFSVGLIISMFFVGFLIALLQTRRKAQLMRSPPPMRTVVKKGTAPKIPPKAPYLPPGKVPKKVVRKKTVTGSDIEVTRPKGDEELIEPERPSGLKFKKPTKRSAEEDIPDDWK